MLPIQDIASQIYLFFAKHDNVKFLDFVAGHLTAEYTRLTLTFWYWADFIG